MSSPMVRSSSEEVDSCNEEVFFKRNRLRQRSVNRKERDLVKDLPDLMDRINKIGLTDEYLTFRERYLGWRQGETKGAKADLSSMKLRQDDGFGFWYPSMQVWQWRRTLSYWIAVTFFEGSLFFTISSFLWCWPERLGRFERWMTTWGYIAGKVNFLICTYLMCVETINLSNDDHTSLSESDSDDSGSSGEGGQPGSIRRRITIANIAIAEKHEEPFRKWPFHFRTALRNLDKLGAGPWPYYASAVYLIGVLTFTIGLATEFTPGLSEELVEWVVLLSFLFGSLFFLLGGAAECIENKVFTTCSWNQGYTGALLNLIGGLWFLIGAVLGFFEDRTFESLFSYGVGSFIYALGSAVMIIMWKDEQFGLTFLAVLNNLGGPDGKPLVRGEEARSDGEGHREEEKTFSLVGATFIMVYCLTGTVSVYDFYICISEFDGIYTTGRVLGRSFNALLPCIFAHMMLALNAGVYKTPRMAPFHQLYIACRWVAIFMLVNSTYHVIEALRQESLRQPPVSLAHEL